MVTLPVPRWKMGSTVSNDDGLCPCGTLLIYVVHHTKGAEKYNIDSQEEQHKF